MKEQEKLRRAFKGFSRQKLNPYVPVLTSITRQSFADMRTAINQSIYHEMLIDNLDLLSITKILLDVDPLANLQAFRNTAQDEEVMELIKLATKMKLDIK